jgi:1,4-dihydroxy-2-naphthoate octaprenyltransferase
MRHLKEQPLHQTLKQYRLISILSIVFLGYMMLEAWTFYEVQHLSMSTEGVAGFFTYVAALLGAFIKSINNIRDKHED